MTRGDVAKLPSRKLQGRISYSRLADEDSIDEHAVFAVAFQIEVVLLGEDLEMVSRYERGVSHVDVDVAPGRIPPDYGVVLSHVEFKVATFEPGDWILVNGLRVDVVPGRRPRRTLRPAGVESEKRHGVVMLRPFFFHDKPID